MDFVVAGLGLGALIVVVGFVIRDLGPILWRVNGGRRSGEREDEERLWTGLCQSISVVLTFAGVAILIATVLAVLLGFSDDLGTQVVIVVSAVAVVAAAALLALNIRDYRKESSLNSVVAPKGLRSATKPLPTSLSSQTSAGDTGTVRLVRKPVEPLESPAAAVSPHVPEPEEYDPHLDEPFDATRLLASEFDHHDSEIELSMFAPRDTPSSESPGPVEGDPIDEVIAEKEVEQAPEVVAFVPVIVESESAEMPDFAPDEPSAPGEDTVLSTVFRSPLLADISGSANTASGSFESKLLADVDIRADDPADEFVSPLFADLHRSPDNNDDDDAEEVNGETAEDSTPVRKS